MSGSQRPIIVAYATAMSIPIVIGILSYVGLVVRENVAAKAFHQKADHVEVEVKKATEFLRRRDSDKVALQEVSSVAEDIKRRVPFGPVDLDVVSFLESEAQKAGIPDLKADVDGGIKIPKNKDDDKRTPIERLYVEPGKLQSSVIDISFSSRYRDCLVLLRAIAQAPWLIQITRLNMERQIDGPKIAVKMQARYLYE